MRVKVRPGHEIAVETRHCEVCRRLTIHDVTIATNGMGEPVSSNAVCRDHRPWTSGRIDVRDPKTGEWVQYARRTTGPHRHGERRAVLRCSRRLRHSASRSDAPAAFSRAHARARGIARTRN
jgi:hypothetical protein